MLATAASTVEAQDLKRFMKKREDAAKETAGDRIGKEADKKIAKGINKGLDKLFGSDEEETPSDPSGQNASGNTSQSSRAAQSASMNALMGAMGMNADVNVKDAYDFDSFVEMTITHYDEDGNSDESGKYITYLDSRSLDYGLQFTDDDQEGTSIMIFDTENALMLTLVESDGQKSGFAVGFDTDQIEEIAEEYETESESDEEVETDTDYNPYNLQKTGKTKTISGYRCDEYMMEDESSIVSIWATDDVDKDIKKTYLTNNNFAGMFFYAYYMDGMVMEYDITDKSDNDRMVMTVTDLDLDRTTTFNTGAYNIMSMGAMEEEPAE